MDDVKLVVAHSFRNRPEAELAKSALEAAGIDSMIQGDSIGGMRPHVAWSSGGFKLVVREEDMEATAEILEPRES